MKQYLEQSQRLLDEGVWVVNARTGERCLTAINADMVYDMREMKLPVATTRKVFWKSAIAEMLGYLRGYDNAAQFRAIGTKTWDANANENKAWLANPNRKGVDDMGRVYGVQGRKFRSHNNKEIDQLRKIVDNLSKGIDDRGEIMTFLNPGETDLMCLRACMHTHTFSLLDGVLYLTSFQRSSDWPLGQIFNGIQVGWLLAIMAQITNNRCGIAYHKVQNLHIYEPQLELMRDVQLKREPYPLPTLKINPDIKTLEDLETWVTTDDFELENYVHHEAIKYPFSV